MNGVHVVTSGVGDIDRALRFYRDDVDHDAPVDVPPGPREVKRRVRNGVRWAFSFCA